MSLISPWPLSLARLVSSASYSHPSGLNTFLFLSLSGANGSRPDRRECEARVEGMRRGLKGRKGLVLSYGCKGRVLVLMLSYGSLVLYVYFEGFDLRRLSVLNVQSCFVNQRMEAKREMFLSFCLITCLHVPGHRCPHHNAVPRALIATLRGTLPMTARLIPGQHLSSLHETWVGTSPDAGCGRPAPTLAVVRPAPPLRPRHSG